MKVRQPLNTEERVLALPALEWMEREPSSGKQENQLCHELQKLRGTPFFGALDLMNGPPYVLYG